MTTTNTTNKPFLIEKWRVYEAYKAVKSNQGAAGVDGQTIEAFEADLKGNLYKIWNRMSSGTYFPPPVRAVSIPKKSGGERILGVPTVSRPRDREQTIVRLIDMDGRMGIVRAIFRAVFGYGRARDRHQASPSHGPGNGILRAETGGRLQAQKAGERPKFGSQTANRLANRPELRGFLTTRKPRRFAGTAWWAMQGSN